MSRVCVFSDICLLLRTQQASSLQGKDLLQKNYIRQLPAHAAVAQLLQQQAVQLRTKLTASTSRDRSDPTPCPASLSSLSDPKPRNYGEVATTVENRSSAKDALEKSCYFKIDFGISEDATVYEAVQRFAAYNIGALAVTNADKRIIGIVSERDYVSKARQR